MFKNWEWNKFINFSVSWEARGIKLPLFFFYNIPFKKYMILALAGLGCIACTKCGSNMVTARSGGPPGHLRGEVNQPRAEISMSHLVLLDVERAEHLRMAPLWWTHPAATWAYFSRVAACQYLPVTFRPTTTKNNWVWSPLTSQASLGNIERSHLFCPSPI